MGAARKWTRRGVLTDYLLQHGALPAYKAADDYLTQAEERLTQRLNRLFEGVQNRLISKLRDLRYIPADPDRRQEFLPEFLGHLYDDPRRKSHGQPWSTRKPVGC